MSCNKVDEVDVEAFLDRHCGEVSAFPSVGPRPLQIPFQPGSVSNSQLAAPIRRTISFPAS